MTNGDKIRGMDNKKLAQFLRKFQLVPCRYCKDKKKCNLPCEKGFNKWLESEAAQ